MVAELPKVLSNGTCRTNRGVPEKCKQPAKNSLSTKQQEELKAKPPAERLKVQMTTSEPRVLCISYWDNGPVHMLMTIHQEGNFLTVSRRRWDGTELKVVKVPIERLAVCPSPARGKKRCKS